MRKTLEELKQTPTYRYLKELTIVYHKAGSLGEPIELPMKAIMEAPMPDYLPVTGAVRLKFMFILSIYQTCGRWGAMQDGLPGIMNMLALAMEDIK